MILLAAALVVLLSFSALGCGGSGDGEGSKVAAQPATAPPATSTDIPTTATPEPAPATTPAATTPAATTPTATTGVPSGGTTGTGTTTGESQPGGGGDEEAIRTPAAFAVSGQGITPARITVAAFLPVDVALTAKVGGYRVTVDAPGGGTIDVAPGGTAHVRLGGLKAGDYVISTTTGRATLHVVAGGDPGP